MDLKDFVAETLQNIVQGIRQAQEADELGGLIAPSGIGGHPFPPGMGVSNEQRIISTVVQFDVAVAAEAASQGGAGVGFKVAVFGIGASGDAGGKISNRDTQTSRVRFSVPVLMPQNKRNWHEA